MLKNNRTYITVVLVTICAGLLPLIIQATFIRYLMVSMLIFSIFGLSLDVILGRMGQFSFGHQVFFGLGAYTTAILTTKLSMPVWFSFFAGILFSGIFGLIVGLVSLKRARGFFLGIITLGVGKITWMVAIKWRALTHSTEGIAFIPPLKIWFPFLGVVELSNEITFYYFALAVLLFTLFILSVWSRSAHGRAVTAIRENEELAQSIGISPYKYYVWAFTFACALAGLAGVMYAHFMSNIGPDSLSMYYMIWMLAVVILGGRNTFSGPIVGAAIFIFLPQLLMDIRELRMVIVGGILLVCILVMRDGIVPSLSLLVKRRINGVLRKPGGQEGKSGPQVQAPGVTG
jgi:branched-chain amino acid transport system permease protein